MTKKATVSKKDAVIVLSQVQREEIERRFKVLNSSHTCSNLTAFECEFVELITPNSNRHLESLKKLGKTVPQLSCPDCSTIVVELLFDALYCSNENHTINAALKGVIKNLPVDCLHIATSLIKNRGSKKVRGDSCFLEISSIAALLQSEFGQQALSQCVTPLISMNEMLQQLLESIHGASSVVEKVEVFTQIHLLTKTLLPLIKLHFNNANNQYIKDILHTLTRVFRLKGLPQEALGNCSNILVTHVVNTRKDWFEIIHAKLFDENSPVQSPLDEIDQTALTKLSLCLALLACLDCTSLLLQKKNGETILGGTILKTTQLSYEGLDDTTQALLVVRLLEQWSRKCLECLESKKSGSDLLAEEWLGARQKLVDMTSMSLEHQVEAVRHSGRSAFQICIKTHIYLNANADPIIDAVISMPRFSKSKYIILSCLAQSNLNSRLVAKDANLARELFEVAVDPALSSQAKEVYQSLMFHDMEGNDGWRERWLYPLLEVMASHNNGPIFDSILIELLRTRVKIVIDIRKWYEANRQQRLPVYISALLAGKRQGWLLCESDSSQAILEVVKEAIDHSDWRLRLNALGVLVEGPKTTQLFSREELGCMKRCIDNDMNNPNPAFRQQLCAYVKKFLMKLRDGEAWLLSREEKKPTLEQYRAFTRWFVEKCLIDLGLGSGFSRRFFSLQFLKHLFDINGIDPSYFVLTPLFNLEAVTSVIDCLFDSYDINKEVALELLCSKPLLNIVNEHPNHADVVNLYWESALSLCQSVKSASTSAASYLFRWMARLNGDQKWNHGADDISGSNVPEKNRYCFIKTLIGILETHVSLAQENLCNLAVDSPIYGSLSCIRLLLNDLSFKEILCNESWNSLVLEVLRLTYSASGVASPVVTSDSPEGFLPDDFDFEISTRFSSQALLVCAWRTVKEVALMFGQLSSWALAISPPFLGNDVIVNMGYHLKELLLETKHRGAFEQVYIGFSIICNALWRSPAEGLFLLPKNWLLDVMDEIRDPKNRMKLCVTRRSAGLPFMFQAVLSPEVEMGRGELFSICLGALLNEASSGSGESRLHCLNILRNLYRESRFNQLIGPYVAKGLMVAITGFEASNWAERNSATLLFTALITRIFGVPRCKTDFHKKNSLTGRMFFQLYPQLYTFLLEQLHWATQDILSKEIHLHPGLFPVLVLVGRLQPPTGESVGSAFDLEPFIPLVRLCGASAVFKTRQLAAQALVPLLTPSASARLLPELIDSIETSVSHNQLHGNLVQIHHLVKEALNRANTCEAVSHVLMEKLPRLIYLLRSPSSLVRYEYACILELIDSKQLLNASFKCALSSACMDELSRGSNSVSIQPFYPVLCEKLAKLVANTPGVDIHHLLDHSIDEVRCAVMEYMIEKKPTSRLETLQPTLLATVASVRNSRRSKGLAILLLSDCAKNAESRLERMLSIYRQATDDHLRCTALKATVKQSDSVESYDFQLLIELSEYLLEATKLGVCYRRAATTAILQLSELFIIDLKISDSEKRVTLLRNLWVVLFRLLLDDDESIRSSTSSLISTLCRRDTADVNPVVALELALDAYVEHIGKQSPEAVVASLVALVIDQKGDQAIESVAFEKEDNDSYWEPLIHSKLLCAKIDECLRKNRTLHLHLNYLATLIVDEWRIVESADVTESTNLANRNCLTVSRLVSMIKYFYITASLKDYNEVISEVHRRICLRLKEIPSVLNNYALFRLNNVSL